MSITTDHKWRDFFYRNQVPAKIIQSQFDWLDNDNIDGFFKYRNRWYHIDEFSLTTLEDWDGIAPDSYFSGVVIKVSSDGEQFKVGTYTV